MLDDRKAAILHAVVREYISTAQPVGSSRVSDAPGVEVSSATVRSEMASLEDEQYLMQPHTSAGRVPTPKGYRFFVDQIRGMTPCLDMADQRQVSEFFSAAYGEISTMLSHTSGLLSDLTDWTGLVVGPSPAHATVRSAQLVDIAGGRILVVTVMSNGVVESSAIEVAAGTTADAVAEASARLARRLVGRTLVEAKQSATDEDPDPLVDAAVAALGENIDHHEVFVGGAAKLAAAFDAAEKLKEVLDVLEHQLVVVSLIQEVLDRGKRVAIGAESGLSSLSDCSLVLAPFGAPGGAGGTIGVLGPTRMDYPQALAAVAVVSERLSNALGDGRGEPVQ